MFAGCMATLLSAGIGLATIAVLLGRLGWPWELSTHFRPHLIVASLLLGSGLAAVGAWPQSVACLAALAANLATFPRLHFVAAREAASEAGVTIVWANVWKRSTALVRTIGFARDQGADVILLGEFPDIDPQALAQLAPEYPFVIDPGPALGRFTTRVVAMSRIPISNVRVTEPPSGPRRAVIWFTLETGRKHLNVSAVHPAAPGTPSMLRDRNALIVQTLDAAQAPYLIAGDFNAAPWSPILSNITPQRVGNPVLESTWLTRWPLFGLPIDQLFVSDDVRPTAYRVGPYLGSDHRALLVRCHVDGR